MKKFPTAHENRNMVNTGRQDGKVTMPGVSSPVAPGKGVGPYPKAGLGPEEPDRTAHPNLRHITQTNLGDITAVTDKLVDDHEDARVPATPLRMERRVGPQKPGEPMPPIKGQAQATDASGPDVKPPKKVSKAPAFQRGHTGY